MERDILALINKENHKFSKGQRMICRYISENYDKAAFMTAGKLGQTVGVSESTVVRFATELGYDGYPGMRRAMQEMIRNRLTAVQRIEVAKEQIDRGNILDAVLSADMDKLSSTIDEVSKEDFNRAVDAILKAETVYIVGMRSSTSLASFLGFYLNLLLDNVRLIHDTSVSEVYEQVFRSHEGDVFLGISFPRYSSRTIKAMQFAKSTDERRGLTVRNADRRRGGYQSFCQERYGFVPGFACSADESHQCAHCCHRLPASRQPIRYVPEARRDLERI